MGKTADQEKSSTLYMHGSDARQHEIADNLSQLARQELLPAPSFHWPP